MGNRAQKTCNNQKLIRVVTSRKQGRSFNHLCQDTPSTPHIDLNIILLPSEHRLRGSVKSSCDIARHLWIDSSRQAEIADFEITVFIY